MPGVVTVFESESAPYCSWGLSYPKANFNLFDSPLQGQKEPSQEAEVQRSKKKSLLSVWAGLWDGCSYLKHCQILASAQEGN